MFLSVFLGSVLVVTLHPAAAQVTSVDLSSRIGDFATRLYRDVASRTDDNVLLAPFSLSTGLAALLSGSDGRTQEELALALGLTPTDAPNIPGLFSNLRTSLEAGGSVSTHQGVAVLPLQAFSVRPAYRELVQSQYAGSVQSLAYSAPSEAEASIDAWAQSQTAERIQEVVRGLDESTQMLLVALATYQSDFALGFNASLTQDERFFVDRYHTVQTPMMFRSDKYYLAYDAPLRLGVLQLPLGGGAAMLVLLPDEGVGVTLVEEALTAERFLAWTRRLKKTKLEVMIPRFVLQTSCVLKDSLKRLHVSHAFDQSADFSKISEQPGLTLSQVVHKAVVTVDESSSSPAGGSRVFSSLPPRLTVNRPFLFIVYHQTTNTILFIGRVHNPGTQ